MKLLPAVKVMLILALGITIAYWNEPEFITCLSVSVICLITAIVVELSNQVFPHSNSHSITKSISTFLSVLSLFFAGATIYSASQPPQNFKQQNLIVHGIVSEPPYYYDTWMSFPVDVSAFMLADTLEVSRKIWVRYKQIDTGIIPGCSIKMYGTLRPLFERRNPGDFDLKTFRMRNGYIGEFFIEDSFRVTTDSHSIPIIYKVRNWIAGKSAIYGGTDAPLMNALMLGIRRHVDDELEENLRRSGLSHLLALSGLHVGFVVAIWLMVGILFRLNITWRFVLVVVVVLVFSILVPMRASTLRAVIMSIVFLIGPLIRRWSPAMNRLGLSGLIILCIRPGDLFDAGFQLSFAAVGGILLFQTHISVAQGILRNWRGKWGRRVSKLIILPLLVSTAASTVVLPIGAYHFGTIPLIAPIFNVIAIPLLGFIYTIMWLTIGFSAFWLWGAGIIGEVLHLSLRIWHWTTNLLGDVALTWDYRLTPISVVVVLSLIILCSLTMAKKPLSRLLIFGVAIILVLTSDTFLNRIERLQIWFLDVGNGDAAVWRFESGETVVIDGGPLVMNDNYPVYNTLNYFNCKEIAIVVASHSDADHIGGLRTVVEQLPVGLALTSKCGTESYSFNELQRVSSERNLNWYSVDQHTQPIIIGNNRIRFVGPPSDLTGWSDNDGSVALVLEVHQDGDTLKLLSAGDIEQKGEMALVNTQDVAAELLKVSHHGSNTSTSQVFLDKVKPIVGVITNAGRSESSKLSDVEETIKRLKDSGVTLHFTDSEGAILFEPIFDGVCSRWQVRDWRKPKFISWLMGR